MFLSRILIIPVIVAGFAFATAPVSANDDEALPPNLDEIADYLVHTIERAHHNPALLDHEFFENMAYFGPDDYVQLALYRALPGIDWYRNHDARHWVSENQPHYYHDFMDANRITVAVVVESNDGYVASMVGERVSASLPPHAIYANDPGFADILISVRLSEMEPAYRERSRKPKSKKYKKKYRTRPPVDEQIHFANYTKVKERVSVFLSYELEVTAGRLRISLAQSNMKLHDNFSYGVDFRAYGPNGPMDGVPYPSKKVRKLMERDVEATRSRIGAKLINMAAGRLAPMLDYDALPLRSELHDHRWRSSYR